MVCGRSCHFDVCVGLDKGCVCGLGQGIPQRHLMVEAKTLWVFAMVLFVFPVEGRYEATLLEKVRKTDEFLKKWHILRSGGKRCE